MRRILASFTVVLCLLLLLDAGIQAQRRTVRLTFWTFVDAHADFFLRRAAEFNQLNPDINLQLDAVSIPYREMHDQLLIALHTGIGAPDLVDIEITPFHAYLREPIHLLDLTSLVDPHRANIVQARLTPYQKDGKQYGIPTHLGAFVMYYNTDLFARQGVDFESIRLWNDYVTAGTKITRDLNGDGRTDQWMTMLDGNGWFQWFGILQQRKSGLFDAQGRVIVDNDVNVEALEFLHDLVYKHQIAMAGVGLHDPVAYQKINAGEVASVWMPQWYMIRYTEFMPDLYGKVAIRPLPAWEPGGFRSAMGGGTGTAITNQIRPENLDVAKRFLEYAKLTYEANVRIWTDFGFDPFRFDVFADPRLLEPLPYFNNESVFKVINEIKDELVPQYLSPVWRDANWEVLGPEVFFPVIGQNQLNPREALRKASEMIQRLLR